MAGIVSPLLWATLSDGAKAPANRTSAASPVLNNFILLNDIQSTSRVAARNRAVTFSTMHNDYSVIEPVDPMPRMQTATSRLG